MEMTRSSDDKKLFVLEGVGEVRTQGMFKSGATLTTSDGRTWEIDRKGIKMTTVISDPAGGTPAEYEPKGTFKRGGVLNVAGDGAYDLKPSSRWKEAYGLFRADHELAAIEAGGWSSKKPVKVDVEGDVDPLVLLCACWLVKQFADDSAAVVTAGAAT